MMPFASQAWIQLEPVGYRSNVLIYLDVSPAFICLFTSKFQRREHVIELSGRRKHW